VKGFGFTCTPAQLDKFYVENFHRYTSGVLVDPSARALLEAAAAAGLRRAIVTNTVSPLAKQLVERAELTSLVETISCVDHVPRAKPAPDLVLHALKSLGVEPNAAWMLGDSKFDRAAANAAGVKFIGLRIDGDARIESLDALMHLVATA
jgi:phosphoglycolate phosphatase/AHBA synthesis associated protein